MAFHILLDDGELWDGEMRGVVCGELKVLLIRAEGQLRAYEDRCAHQAYPLSRGRLEGRMLTCSAHEWCFDVLSGQGINPPEARLRPLVVRVQNGKIGVEL